MTAPVPDMLDRNRREAGLTTSELFLRYFALGGMSDAFELEAFLLGFLRPTPHDHDLIAHALNERFVELGGNHPVPYSDQTPPPGPPPSPPEVGP